MTEPDDWINKLNRLDEHIEKYMNPYKGHFWGFMALFWSIVVATVWLIYIFHH